MSVRHHFSRQARWNWIAGVLRLSSIRPFLDRSEVSVRFHFHAQAQGIWNRHFQEVVILIDFWSLGVCFHFCRACAGKWLLTDTLKFGSDICFVIWSFPASEVSVRFHFPAQGREKCKQTLPKHPFPYALSYWFLALFGGVREVHFSAQARGI